MDKDINRNTLQSKFGLEATRNRNHFFASSDKRASPTAVGDARLLLSLGGVEDEKKNRKKSTERVQNRKLTGREATVESFGGIGAAGLRRYLRSTKRRLKMTTDFWRLSDDVHEVLGSILVDGGENVVELGRVAGDSMKCELYFRLSKPTSGLMNITSFKSYIKLHHVRRNRQLV